MTASGRTIGVGSRRRFVKQVMAGSAAAVAAPLVIPSSALGLDGAAPPSERVRVAGIGIGRRGEYDLGCFLQQPDVQFVAVCDVKQGRRDAVKAIADKHHGTAECRTYRDFRELLDQADVDAVLIATGPNWHGLMAMLAARAGKDVYCEKPCTKNIAETLVHRDTMNRCGTIFQAGTQRRNLPHFAFACELARTGRLGTLKRVYAHPAGMKATTSGWLPEEPAPDSKIDDWDMYLGPAAWRPFFGPVLPLIPFDSEAEAVAAANNTEYGLAAYVLTRDISTALRVSEALEYGIIGLNDAVPTVPQAPFGGWKESGMNREGGYEGIHSYMEVKYISVGV